MSEGFTFNGIAFPVAVFTNIFFGKRPIKEIHKLCNMVCKLKLNVEVYLFIVTLCNLYGRSLKRECSIV